MYHRVADDPFDPWGLAVTPEHFSDQLAWLSRHRKVLRLGEFAELHRRGSLPNEAVALTFDDGYACNAETAAPLLERLKIPATIFLPAELIGKGEPFWWDELEEIVFEHEGPSLTVDGEQVALGAKRAEDRRWKPGRAPRTPRQAAFHDLHLRIVTKKAADIDDAMADLRRQSERRLNGRAQTKSPMTPEQVRNSASSLVEFGSHALTHPWLIGLTPEEQRREIGDSVDQCRSLTGSRPAALAYPFGRFNEESERIAQEAGFDCACSSEHAAVSTDSRLFALPRVQVGNWTAAGLARALSTL